MQLSKIKAQDQLNYIKTRENILGTRCLELSLVPFSKCYATFNFDFYIPTMEQQNNVTLHRILKFFSNQA